jgi:hypothetical protein
MDLPLTLKSRVIAVITKPEAKKKVLASGFLRIPQE